MIGDEVRRRREGLGLTGAQLAARAGMAPSAVSQIETGKRTPSSASVIKLAGALGAEVGDLYPKKGQAPLPLPDFAEQRNGATEPQEGGPYTAFEAFGQVLAFCWEGEALDWETRIPDGFAPDPMALGRLLQWALDITTARAAYKEVADREYGAGRRGQLEDTLRSMEEIERNAFAKLKRARDETTTWDAAFQRIWEENDLDAIISEAESR